MTIALQDVLHKKHRLYLLLALLLCLGFAATSMVSYFVSRASIRSSIVSNELPLTSDNIFSEIQKDLIRPIFISSMMASDTFLRDWVLSGETDVKSISRYLTEVRHRYDAVSSFFVSEKTRQYYHANGILKSMHEEDPIDSWYFRVRKLAVPYEINVDPDMANKNTLTIFINYRAYDYSGNFLGVAGIGLAVDAVRGLVKQYQSHYHRRIFFVDAQGHVVLNDADPSTEHRALQELPGLQDIAQQLMVHDGDFEYQLDGHTHLLNTRFIPELNWYLFVETTEDDATANIRNALYLNLGFCAGITLVVLFLVGLTMRRYQHQVEQMATTDALTGLINRQSLDLLMQHVFEESRRHQTPSCVVMIDIDHFKAINDHFGHLAGDSVLCAVAAKMQLTVRSADILCRWGGEEFLVVLRHCSIADALILAEKLRISISDNSLQLEQQSIPVTISLGVACWRANETIEQVIKRADVALYLAKESGRNRVNSAELVLGNV